MAPRRIGALVAAEALPYARTLCGMGNLPAGFTPADRTMANMPAQPAQGSECTGMARFRAVLAQVCEAQSPAMNLGGLARAALHQAVYDWFGRRLCKRRTWTCCMGQRTAHVVLRGDKSAPHGSHVEEKGMACSNERGTAMGARGPLTQCQPAALSGGVLA